jgi:CRISPR/Cas system type I-B associated protein Csh2 (Cas7 group RAMP superfamily)
MRCRDDNSIAPFAVPVQRCLETRQFGRSWAQQRRFVFSSIASPVVVNTALAYMTGVAMIVYSPMFRKVLQ